jgi:AcrR family transcriptional regulator
MVAEQRMHAARWRRRKAARPSEILAAALAAFVERGFAATRLDDVARRAGVTKGTLYLYFPNKAELFKAVVAQAVVPSIERGEAKLESAAASGAVVLEQLMRGWAEVARSPAGAIPKIIVAEAGNFPDLARFYQHEVVDRGMAVFRRVLRIGVERGEFRAVDIDNAALCLVAPLLLAMLWRHSLGRHARGGFDPDTLCATLLDLLLHGLAAPPAMPAAPNTDQPPVARAAGIKEKAPS